MLRIMCKSKLHRARVTEKDLEYEGSITIDEALMEKADIIEGEQLQVINIENGARFYTYAIKGKRGSGIICLNGGASRLGEIGDRLIIISYAITEEKIKPKVILLDEKNRIVDERV